MAEPNAYSMEQQTGYLIQNKRTIIECLTSPYNIKPVELFVPEKFIIGNFLPLGGSLENLAPSIGQFYCDEPEVLDRYKEKITDPFSKIRLKSISMPESEIEKIVELGTAYHSADKAFAEQFRNFANKHNA